MKGKIKWYNETKGFGFIEAENAQDVFLHRTGLPRSFMKLEPGVAVEFEVKNSEKGLVAVNVKVIE
jgi:CspA family cold shock protein